MTQEQALLALVADLYAQIGVLRQQNAELQSENERLQRQPSEGNGGR